MSCEISKSAQEKILSEAVATRRRFLVSGNRYLSTQRYCTLKFEVQFSHEPTSVHCWAKIFGSSCLSCVIFAQLLLYHQMSIYSACPSLGDFIEVYLELAVETGELPNCDEFWPFFLFVNNSNMTSALNSKKN
jgi:hypothetical protein